MKKRFWIALRASTCYSRSKGGCVMELRVLRYFLVVAREENITRAAA